MNIRDLNDLVVGAKKHAPGVEMLCRTAAGHETTWDAELRDGEVSSAELTVRVWLQGGCRGSASGSPSRSTQLLASAMKRAEKGKPDPLAGPVGRVTEPAEGLMILDRRFDRIDAEARAEVLESARTSAAGVNKAYRLTELRYRGVKTWRGYANSKGVVLDETSTSYSVGARLDSDGLCLDAAIDSVSFASIASLPLGTTLAKRHRELLVDGETLDGEVVMVLGPLPTSQLFAALAPAFDAAAIEAGKWWFHGQKEPAFSSKIHLIDDGRLPGGLLSRSFDDRGVASVPLTLIREGVVDGRYLSPRQARALRTRPTGHVTGKSNQGTNLVLRGGTRSISATLADRGGMSLRVDSLPMAGLDPATGRLTGEISGLVMKGNKVVGAVRNRPFRAELATMMRAVTDVMADTDRHGAVDAPSLRMEGLQLL